MKTPTILSSFNHDVIADALLWSRHLHVYKQHHHQPFFTVSPILEYKPMADEVKLLGSWLSPFVLTVHVALAVKGVKYEYQEEDLQNKSELLLESNPVHKKVPVLIHNGRPVCESAIIVQYIDEAFVGPKLLPVDPYERHTARFWVAYINDKLVPLIFSLRKLHTEAELAEPLGQLHVGLQLLEGVLNSCSGWKGFFGGDSIGFLDAVLGGYVQWIRAIEQLKSVKIVEEEKTPLLAAWMERFQAADAVKGALPGVDKLYDFVKSRFG